MGRIVRKTSLLAYRKLVDEGRLSQTRALVYATVFRHGPMTELEAHDRLKKGGRVAWSTVTGRFSELYRMDLFGIVGETRNRRGNLVNQWDVTAREEPLPLGKAGVRINWKTRARKLEGLVVKMIRQFHDYGDKDWAELMRGKLEEIRRGR